MESYSIQITDYLLRQSWQIAVLVVVVAAVTLALNNKSAHVRYLLWLIVLAKCLVPPLLTVALPVLPEARPAIVVAPPGPIEIDPVKAPVVEAPEPAAPAAPAVAKHTPRITVRQWLAAGWIAGVAMFALVALVKALRTELWLRRERKPLPAGLQSEVKALLSSLAVKMSPKLWLIEGIGQPFVWGLLRGEIYLPANFVNVNGVEHRRGILGHELSHILRFDAVVNLLQIIAQAVFWFHPFVWWANKRIRAEREKCCDEMAIARLNAKAKDYSSAIVNILVSEHESTRPVPSLAVAGPVKNIEERIKTMLRPGKKFYKRPSLPVAAIVVLTALLAVPTTVVLTARAEDQTSNGKTDTEWTIGTPTNLGPAVNSSAPDYDPSISADGFSLYFASPRPGGYGNNDLYVTSRKTTDDPWETPVNLGPTVNSSGWDNAPSISADGLSLYFSSDRPGGYGERDLWVTMRETASAPWGAPVNLGPTVNSPANEHGPSISVDGLSLYFAERHIEPVRPGGLGNSDIWVTMRKTKADPWGTPVNLGPIVNSSGFEEAPDISGDQRMLFFCSPRTGGVGSLDLWVTMRSMKDADWGTPINLGPNVNSSLIENTPNISIDGSILYFHSRRPGARGGSDDTDIWQVSLKAQGPKDDFLTLADAITATKSLHQAAAEGDVDQVKALISKGADVNARDENEETPLHHAAEKSHKEVAELLLAKGAIVNAKDKWDYTPLYYAIWEKDKETVKFLVTKGADVNYTPKDDYPPLHYAVWNKDVDMSKLFVNNGANFDVKDMDGWTAFRYAVDGANRGLVDFFIAEGAKLSDFHFAAWLGDLTRVRQFIEEGRDVNIKDDQLNWTPLHWATFPGRRDVAEFLISKGCDVNANGDFNDPPLHYAAVHGHIELVEMFLTKGADINAKDSFGKTPLRDAARTDHWEVVTLLLRRGADINAQYASGLLHRAVEKGYKDVAELLIAKGADVNAKSRSGRSALHQACLRGEKDLVELLIAKGADMNAKDNNQQTALSLAKEYVHDEIIELLRKHGAKE